MSDPIEVLVDAVDDMDYGDSTRSVIEETLTGMGACVQSTDVLRQLLTLRQIGRDLIRAANRPDGEGSAEALSALSRICFDEALPVPPGDPVEPTPEGPGPLVLMRRAQRDANVNEILSLLSDLAAAPSKWKADETRAIAHRARDMMRSLLIDVKGWEEA